MFVCILARFILAVDQHASIARCVKFFNLNIFNTEFSQTNNKTLTLRGNHLYAKNSVKSYYITFSLNAIRIKSESYNIRTAYGELRACLH